MVRMQVLGLDLLLMLSWAGWASSATVDPRKTIGRWYHIFTASNKLEELSDHDHLRLYSPFLECIGRNCDAISLGFQYSYLKDCDSFSELMSERRRGVYETSILERIIRQIVDVTDTMLILSHIDRHRSHNDYAVLALGRERTLSDTDMEKFQKVLQDKGIEKEPVRFTGDDICRRNQV